MGHKISSYQRIKIITIKGNAGERDEEMLQGALEISDIFLGM